MSVSSSNKAVVKVPKHQQDVFVKWVHDKVPPAFTLKPGSPPVVGSSHLVAAFREQPLTAKCDAEIRKGTIFRRSYAKVHAELRGCTMVLFESSKSDGNVAASAKVMAVLLVPYFNFNIDRGSRIIVSGSGLSGSELFLSPDDLDMKLWTKSLARYQSAPLPSLPTMKFMSIIGRGGQGQVFAAFDRAGKQAFAVKVIGKREALSSRYRLNIAVSERNLMLCVGDHPFILPMKFAFQSDHFLFLGTPLCTNGNLEQYVANRAKENGLVSPDPLFKTKRYGGHLHESVVVAVVAEILLAIEHMQSKGVLHRDLKPDNIFIDSEGHTQLGDLGLAKQLPFSRRITCNDGVTRQGLKRTNTQCGTKPYMSPEILLEKWYGFECDMWSVGILVFRLLVGRYPFEKEDFLSGRYGELHLPSFLSFSARHLLRGLLDLDQDRRKKLPWVKNHAFFKCVDWDTVFRREGPSLVKTRVPMQSRPCGSKDGENGKENESLFVIQDEKNQKRKPNERVEDNQHVIGYEYVRVQKKDEKLVLLPSKRSKHPMTVLLENKWKLPGVLLRGESVPGADKQIVLGRKP